MVDAIFGGGFGGGWLSQSVNCFFLSFYSLPYVAVAVVVVKHVSHSF